MKKEKVVQKTRVTMNITDLMKMAKEYPNVFSSRTVKKLTKPVSQYVKLTDSQIDVLLAKSLLIYSRSRGQYRLASELPNLLKQGRATSGQVLALEKAFSTDFPTISIESNEW